MSLDKPLRGRLERTILQARQVAETAARNALQQLGIEEAAPPPYLSLAQGELHRKLRIHGHQLGDAMQEASGRQEIVRLAEEVAYQHWHRMLFARFLAENDLLMVPDPENPVALNLEECQDLAPSYGARNGWELASLFASRMLPQIFRPDSPVFELELPLEHQQELERLLAELPAEVFLASDSLGWVYQFWQAKRKDEINTSETKIGARELPAVTQLFTEPYMVHFLLDNSLGAWWAARRLTEDDLKNAKTEDELRRKASLPGMPLEYLRFIKGEDGKWTPAAGTFDGWPADLSALKVLDPCCGSGHFLIVAFLMLVAIRMEREGLALQDAVDAVLRDNLYGLEIDPRCTEIAAFNIALTAWRYPNAGGFRQLPELNVACSGLSISAKKEDWLALAGGDGSLSFHLEQLYNLFKDAPTLGSLINPSRLSNDYTLFAQEWKKVQPVLAKAIAEEKSDEKVEMGMVARGIVRAAALLVSSEYTLVITNVPYLLRRRQDEKLLAYCDAHHYDARNDLAICCLERLRSFVAADSSYAAVLPLNWTFQQTDKVLRRRWLRDQSWLLDGRLGTGAFETISGEVVNVGLFVFQQSPLVPGHTVAMIDAIPARSALAKAELLKHAKPLLQPQEALLANPDSRVIFGVVPTGKALEEFADCLQGIVTGDDGHLKRVFWESPAVIRSWIAIQGTVPKTMRFGGRESLVYWGEDGSAVARPQGLKGWKRLGVSVNRMSGMCCCIYSGDAFDINVAAIVPYNAEHVPAAWSFCSSSEFRSMIRKLDQKLNVTNATIGKVPFDIAHWQKVSEEEYPNGLPEPESDDPTQWLFHGRPEHSTTPLQVAVARLLGYRWPAELDEKMRLSARARDLVKRCDELMPIADKDGIVCIPPVRGETSAADRLLNLLAAAYGSDWNTDLLSTLLKDAGFPGRSLDNWLRDGFFTQHCNLFHQRPFVWHIWDGLRDGFSALVNYHKVDHKNLETLIYTYLGDWITRQRLEIASNTGGAEERLAAAEILKKRLELILEGEAPCDIFVRWKPIEMQPIGWEPDLNDGVRLNIRPFLSVPDVRVKGAGVLRDKPKIKWDKDRGKDVASAPWFPLHKGERINDHHLSLQKKQEARQKKEVP